MLTFLLYIHIHLLTSSEVLSFFCFVNTYIYFLSPPLPSSSDNNTFCASARYTFVSGRFCSPFLSLAFFVSTPLSCLPQALDDVTDKRLSRFLQPAVTAVVLSCTKSQCPATSNPRETKKTGGEDCGALYALYFAFYVSR